MSTPFTKIYNRAIFKIKDYTILDIETNIRNIILYNYLLSAQTQFQPYCKIDLSLKNEEEGYYEEDLSEEVIEILSLGIAYYWVTSETLDQDKLHNRLNTKDAYSYSPANLMLAINQIRTDCEQDFRQAIVRYTFQKGDLSNPNG